MTTIRTVAVIGAGQMGSGIAQAVASGGYEVRLYDLAADRLPVAIGTIESVGGGSVRCMLAEVALPHA